MDNFPSREIASNPRLRSSFALPKNVLQIHSVSHGAYLQPDKEDDLPAEDGGKDVDIKGGFPTRIVDVGHAANRRKPTSSRKAV